MSCRIHEGIDLTRYLLDPRAGEFDAFRLHYPACPDCAESLRVWTAIERSLAHPPHALGPPGDQEAGADPVPWHPEPEALARHAGGPGSTRSSEAQTMQRHIEHCPSCRTEWRALAHFDFAAAIDDPWSSAATHAEPRNHESGRARWARWLGLDAGWGTLAAGVLAIAVLVFFAWLAVSPDRRDPRDVERLVEGGTPVPAVPEANVPAPQTPAESASTALASDKSPSMPPVIEGRLIAEVERAAPMRESQAQVDVSTATPTAEPLQLTGAAAGGGAPQAVTAFDDSGDEQGADAGRSKAQPSTGEDILLASLSNMPPPDYAPPAGASQLAWMHQFGSVRGASRGPDAAEVRAHAPDHVGLTHEASPRLWWSLDAPALQPVVVTVVDDREIDPVLEFAIEGPQTAGLHSISLADHAVVLEPDLEYRWFVTLVVDEERPSRNPISAGSIKFVVPDAETEQAIAASEPAERGHVLARAGYWYDAYDFFAGLCQRHPDVAALGSHRDRLLAASTIQP